jgi:hypothetical protein
MSEAQAALPSSPEGASAPARLFGVLFTPRKTYADIAAHPRWLGAFIVIVLLSSAVAAGFLATDVGRNALIDQQIAQAEAYGRPLNQAQIDRIEQMSPYFKYLTPFLQLVGLALGALVVAGISFAVFNAGLGSDQTFKQTFAVVVYSGVIFVVRALFSTPLAYARETLSSGTSLAVFAPFLDESSFATRALGSIDLFVLWWIVSLAIGLGVLHHRRTGSIATTLIAVYLAIGVVVAAVKTAVSGA